MCLNVFLQNKSCKLYKNEIWFTGDSRNALFLTSISNFFPKNLSLSWYVTQTIWWIKRFTETNWLKLQTNEKITFVEIMNGILDIAHSDALKQEKIESF